ncbi:MAG TPA: ABC transporter permease [Myxococcales bacterium]|nr:ABC transporter permease [Myxococcales bacterium]
MQNLRLALRSLLRAPGFTGAGVLVLAIAIGGSTAVFSVLRGVLLRPLGFRSPEQLIRIYEKPAGTDSHWGFSGPDFLDLAAENNALESTAGIRVEQQTLTGHGDPTQVRIARVSASFFSTLRAPPIIGRAPVPEEDVEGTSRVAVLTDGFWRREMGGNPAALGRTLTLDGRTYTVVGVMPPDFHFPLLRQAEILIPLVMEGREKEFRGMNWVTVVARLKPGLGVREAQADLDVLAPRLHGRIAEHEGWHIEAQPLLEDLVGPVKPALTALLGAVLLALLLACADLASLFLARGIARQRELAIRAALGGGRAELIRQLMTEAMLLAAIGGAVGLVIAPWFLSGLLALAPRDTPRLDEIHLDGAVLLFSLVASTAAGLLAGLIPALQITQPHLMEVLTNGSGGTAKRPKARSALVVVETALAFVLAVGAGLMIRTISGLLEVPTGLASPERVVVADMDLPQSRYPPERIATLARDLLQRLSAASGVRSAAMASNVPLDPRGRAEFGFGVEGEASPPGQSPKAEIVFASPGYLETMGVPLLHGRDIQWTDVSSSPHVVLVNEAFVRRFFPSSDPLGRRVTNLVGSSDLPWAIVGVLGDVHTQGLDRAPAPLIVVPLLQYPLTRVGLAARSAGRNPMQLLPTLRSELNTIDKDVPLSSPRVLSQIVDASLGARRFQMTLLSIFAAVALTLAALGIYGVTAYSVTQRAREIGIRMALGAAPGRVLQMVLGGGVRLSLLGVAIGLVAALPATRALQTLVYRVSTTDPITLVATGAVLIGAAALASWAPARRAIRLDPATSLRAE